VGSLIDTSVLAGAYDAGELTDEWAVSVVTVGELEAGILIAQDAGTRARRVALLAAVLAEAPALPIDRHIAARYGELRASAGRRPRRCRSYGRGSSTGRRQTSLRAPKR
jgi:predicted nucleic acid-binding protein